MDKMKLDLGFAESASAENVYDALMANLTSFLRPTEVTWHILVDNGGKHSKMAIPRQIQA